MKQNTAFALSNIFGNCPDVKILECFADNYKDYLPISDIVYLSNVPRTTVYRRIKKLLEKKIIEKGRQYGKTQLYKLNMNNEIARSIVDLEALIVQKGMEETMKKEGIEIPLTIPVGRLISKETPSVNALVTYTETPKLSIPDTVEASIFRKDKNISTRAEEI